ncbi:hypothetical protein GCM10022205_33010 [Spinactinospora alkalitolerans]
MATAGKVLLALSRGEVFSIARVWGEDAVFFEADYGDLRSGAHVLE